MRRLSPLKPADAGISNHLRFYWTFTHLNLCLHILQQTSQVNPRGSGNVGSSRIVIFSMRPFRASPFISRCFIHYFRSDASDPGIRTDVTQISSSPLLPQNGRTNGYHLPMNKFTPGNVVFEPLIETKGTF